MPDIEREKVVALKAVAKSVDDLTREVKKAKKQDIPTVHAMVFYVNQSTGLPTVQTNCATEETTKNLVITRDESLVTCQICKFK